MSTQQEPLHRWPDLSAYGLYFGILTVPGGAKRLIMLDETGMFEDLAAEMKFSSTKWKGLWSRADLNFTIPKAKERFPKVKIVQKTSSEIIGDIRDRLVTLQASKAEPERRYSWRATTEASDAAAQRSGSRRSEVVETAPVPSADVAPIPSVSALAQTVYLGTNHAGMRVFEAADGSRFTRRVDDDAVVASEPVDAPPSAIFLRAGNDEDFQFCAAGLVLDIEHGHNLKSEDFERYLTAISGADALKDEASILRFHYALDKAMIAAVHNKGRGEPAYQYAARLHEGRPSYSRPSGTYPTPLPIAVLLQHLATAAVAPVDKNDPESESSISPSDSLANKSVIDVGGGHTWTYPGTKNVSREDDIPAHDISIGGIFGESVDPSVHLGSGVRVSRSDHLRLLDLLTYRNADGVSALIVNAGEHCGKLSPEFRRVLSWVGMQYHVLGLADLPDTLVAPGSGIHSRLLVVGNRRAEPDIAWSVPAAVEVVHDYDSLWQWASERVASHEDPDAFFGESVVATNRWQVPYIPSSQCSEPETMAPRNLLGPVRKALFNLTEDVGMGVDEYVASQLQVDLDRLPDLLSAEQVDAVALIIHGWQKNGFINADQTGIGKGRVLAAVSRYAKLNGYSVMFLTESKDLLQDFYRDLSHVDTVDIFDQPAILPTGITITDENTGEAVMGSMSSIERSRLLESGGMAGADLLLATYSQFNRKPPSANEFAHHLAAQNIVAGLDITGDLRAAITEFDHTFHHNTLGTVLPAAKTDLAQPVGDILAAIDQYAASLTEEESSQREHAIKQARRLVSMSESDLRAQCKKRLLSITEIRQHWITHADFSRTFLLLDESHNAAGPTSQINANLAHAIDTAVANVNSSATFAREKKNFGLYRRVFPNRLQANIEEIVRKGGEPVQEVIAAMLCADGRMIRREHDLSNVDFIVSVDERHSERNEAWMDSVARAICFMARISNEVHESVLAENFKHTEKFEKAVDKAAIAHLEATVGKDEAKKILDTLSSVSAKRADIKTAKEILASATNAASVRISRMGVGYTNFSSRFFNLNRTLMLAVAADHTAENAIRALESGRKPVIALESTMQSVIIDLVSSDDDVDFTSMTEAEFAKLFSGEDESTTDGSDSSKDIKVHKIGKQFGFRDLLRRQAERLFSVIQYEKKNGKIVRAVRNKIDLSPEKQAALDAVYQLIDQIPSDIPISPIDVVRRRIADAGYNVDEISGRTHELVDLPDGQQILRPIRKASKQEVKDAFNNGNLDAVIITRSGSTGISLHSFYRYADLRPRELIEMQPANDILQRLQFWGRINRKGQVNHPTIRLQSSNLPSEKRLLALQINSLRALSANVTGNADNSAIDCSIPDIINSVGNEICFRYLEANPDVASTLGIKVGNLDESLVDRGDAYFVNQLTSKIIMLPTADGNRILDHIFKEFESVMNEHSLRGTNPLQPARYDIRAKVVSSRPVHTFVSSSSASHVSSVFDQPLEARHIAYVRTVSGHKPQEVSDAIARGKIEFDAFMRSAPNFKSKVEKIAHRLGSFSLPGRLASVEAALADEGVNATKSLFDRANWLVNHIDVFRPGAVISIDGVDGEESLLVTGFRGPFLGGWGSSNSGWSSVRKNNANRDDDFNQASLLDKGEQILDDDEAMDSGNESRNQFSKNFESVISRGDESSLLSLAMYDIRCISSERKDPLYLTFSSIYNMQDKIKVIIPHDATDYKKQAEDFYKNLYSPIPVRAERTVLCGNVIEACAAMRALGKGTVATFSNDKGVWEHGVVMPAEFLTAELRQLPVVIEDGQTMLDALEDCFYIKDKAKDESFVISGRGTGLSIVLHGAAGLHSNVMNNVAVNDCLSPADRWGGTRSRRTARVLPGRELEFCNAVLAPLNADGHKPVVINGSMWLETRANQAAQKMEKAAALNKDLDALLNLAP